MTSPLDGWRFLIGEWKGESKTEREFGEKGKIEGAMACTSDPSDKFIMSKGESWSAGQLVNKSISILFYDDAEQKFRRKTFFSYGFVNNEVECSRDKSEINFDVTMEPMPKQFKGTQWRSFIRKISDSKVIVGLEMAKQGEAFKSYGEEILVKKT